MTLRGLPPSALLAALGAALLLALVQTVRLALRASAQRRLMQRRREQGAAGEVRAEILLRKLGYTILGRQVSISYGVWIDGEPIAIDLRADYLVARDDRRYVAEVKTGRLAPRIDTPATRRQLLEYRLAFAVDGVLLVDADAGRVRTVVFPIPTAPAAPPSRAARAVWLLAGATAGLLAALAARFAP